MYEMLRYICGGPLICGVMAHVRVHKGPQHPTLGTDLERFHMFF